MTWRKFWIGLLATLLGATAFVYATIVVVDPYDTLILSPPFERAPVVSNQRFSFPALARKAKFDSAIFGTSTSRLLRPKQLDNLFGVSFVNLSMNSGTPYEQSRIFDLFARHHPRPGAVIFAIDGAWCVTGDSYTKFTFRPFPPWLYDEDKWNDFLHLLDLKTIEQTGLQFAYLTGIHPAPRRGLDGYTNFLPPRNEYDLARARTHIYGGREPRSKPPAVPPVAPTVAERAAWKFPTHEMFAGMLGRLPAETLKIVMFVPYHAYLQPARGSGEAARWRECKRRFARMAAAGEGTNTHVLDFMISSDITERDENYWDKQHFSLAVAERLGELIAAGAREGRGQTRLFDYLRPADFE